MLKYKLFVSRRPLLNERHKEWEDFNVRETTPLLTLETSAAIAILESKSIPYPAIFRFFHP